MAPPMGQSKPPADDDDDDDVPAWKKAKGPRFEDDLDQVDDDDDDDSPRGGRIANPFAAEDDDEVKGKGAKGKKGGKKGKGKKGWNMEIEAELEELRILSDDDDDTKKTKAARAKVLRETQRDGLMDSDLLHTRWNEGTDFGIQNSAKEMGYKMEGFNLRAEMKNARQGEVDDESGQFQSTFLGNGEDQGPNDSWMAAVDEEGNTDTKISKKGMENWRKEQELWKASVGAEDDSVAFDRGAVLYELVSSLNAGETPSQAMQRLKRDSDRHAQAKADANPEAAELAQLMSKPAKDLLPKEKKRLKELKKAEEDAKNGKEAQKKLDRKKAASNNTAAAAGKKKI